MDEDEINPLIPAIARIRFQLNGARRWIASWPEDRSEHVGWLYEFAKILCDLVNLFIPLADAYITPLHVTPRQNNTHMETFNWIHYCKSWAQSVRLLADRHIFYLVTYRINERTNPTLGVVLDHADIADIRRNTVSIVGSEALNDAFRSRDEMNPQWSVQPPSALTLMLSLQERREAWKVTEIAMGLVELLNCFYRGVELYCELEDERQAQLDAAEVVNGEESGEDNDEEEVIN